MRKAAAELESSAQPSRAAAALLVRFPLEAELGEALLAPNPAPVTDDDCGWLVPPPANWNGLPLDGSKLFRNCSKLVKSLNSAASPPKPVYINGLKAVVVCFKLFSKFDWAFCSRVISFLSISSCLLSSLT